MVDLNVLLFICLSLPMSMMIAVCRGKSRTLAIFIVLGCFACFAAGEIDGQILANSTMTKYYMTVNVTPITEELCKALPILIFAFRAKPDAQHLLESAIACGIGFAMQENAFIFAQNVGLITFGAACIRGLGAGLMHSICTFTVGYGIALFEWKKKWFFTGTTALYAMAVIYHALYNLLIQSTYMIFGILLTGTTFCLIVRLVKKKRS